MLFAAEAAAAPVSIVAAAAVLVVVAVVNTLVHTPGVHADAFCMDIQAYGELGRSTKV